MNIWSSIDDKREGRQDYERYHRPDYERDIYRYSDREYFEGYKEAEREENRRSEDLFDEG